MVGLGVSAKLELFLLVICLQSLSLHHTILDSTLTFTVLNERLRPKPRRVWSEIEKLQSFYHHSK